jgi:hypothetical protein
LIKIIRQLFTMRTSSHFTPIKKLGAAKNCSVCCPSSPAITNRPIRLAMG